MSEVNGTAMHDRMCATVENGSSFLSNGVKDDKLIWPENIKQEPDEEGYSTKNIDNPNSGDQNLGESCDRVKIEPRSPGIVQNGVMDHLDDSMKTENDENSNASSTELYTWKDDNADNQGQSSKMEQMVMYIQTRIEEKMVEKVNSNENTSNQNRRKRKGTKPKKLQQSIEIEAEVYDFNCTICDERFHKKIDLKRHAKIHLNAVEHICKVCGEQFDKRIELKKHERIHTGRKKHKCELCSKVCNRKAELNGHMRTHTGEKPYLCPICGKGFGFAHHLKGHLLTHTGEKPHVCEICGRAFNDRSSMRRHIKTHSNKTEVIEDPVYDENGVPTGEKRSVMIRSLAHTYERSLICEFCGKSFYKAQHLKVHVRTHTGEKPHQCEGCGKQFNDPSSLRRHRKTYAGRPHGLSDDKTKEYKCPICSKEFSYNRNFRYHVKRHSSEKTHECATCGKKYHTRHHLRQHIKSHTADKPYKCTVCQKRFGTYSMWYCHSRTHKGDRKYQCDFCMRFFMTGAHLKSHLATHKGEEPYSCIECGKTFTLNSTLKKHLKLHSEKPEYECSKCGKQFLEEIILKQHLFLVHAGDFDEEEFFPKNSDFGEEFKIDDANNSADQLIEEKTQTSQKLPEHDELDPQIKDSIVAESGLKHSNQTDSLNVEAINSICGSVSQRGGSSSAEACGSSSAQACGSSSAQACGSSSELACGSSSAQGGDGSITPPDANICSPGDDGLVSPGEAKPYSCSYCSKSYKDKRYLKEHIRMHTGINLHECEVCGKKFTKKSNYRRHLEAHGDGLIFWRKPNTIVMMEGEDKDTSLDNVNREPDLPSQTESNQHICTECGESFNEKRHLTEHFRFHTGLNLLECELCGQKFTTESYFKQHMEGHSDEIQQQMEAPTGVNNECNEDSLEMDSSEKQIDNDQDSTFDKETNLYTCSECGKGFKERRYLAQHYKIHTGQNLHECEICGRTWTKRANLLQHMQIHNLDESNCVELNSSCEGTSPMNYSQTQAMLKPHVCTECGRSFKEKRYLSEHFRIHTGENLHQCRICGKKFTKKSHFKRHILTHSDYPMEELNKDMEKSNKIDFNSSYDGVSMVKPYPCSECDRSFSDRGSLTTHFKIHTGEDLHECQFCHKKFTKKPNFLRHEKSCGGGRGKEQEDVETDFIETNLITNLKTAEENKPYACSECDKRFSEKSSLTIHFRLHTGLNLHKCEVCGKKFAKKSHFQRHVEIHSGNHNQYKTTTTKPYPCSECHKSFSDKGSLTTHFRIHTGVNVRECDVCGKKFTKNYNFLRHIRTHTGDRPYVCTFCGKGFSENNSLARHVKNKHTDKTPFNCHLCSEGFYTEFSLDKHIVTHENDPIKEKSPEKVQPPEKTERDILREEMAPSMLIQEIINEMMDEDEPEGNVNKGHNLTQESQQTRNDGAKNENNFIFEVKIEPVDAE